MIGGLSLITNISFPEHPEEKPLRREHYWVWPKATAISTEKGLGPEK